VERSTAFMCVVVMGGGGYGMGKRGNFCCRFWRRWWLSSGEQVKEGHKRNGLISFWTLIRFESEFVNCCISYCLALSLPRSVRYPYYFIIPCPRLSAESPLVCVCNRAP
jgi:hypothetical protein